jgi:hypothetical protein
MTGDERETLQLLVAVANKEVSGRVTLTLRQCKDLYRLYEAEPLYVLWDYPLDLKETMGRYARRRRNRQMNALLITYLLRAAEGMVQLHVGRRMALGLLAMLDADVRADALVLADRWRKQRERGETDG